MILPANTVREDVEKLGTGRCLDNCPDDARRFVLFCSDIRSSRYWGMQDVIDEALQRLYWACRQGRGFPGTIPDESSGRVSTDAILRGLGLSPPSVDHAHASRTRSDLILETQAQVLARRSYHPPDIPPQPGDRSRTGTVSSAITPMSAGSGDKLTFGDEASETSQRTRNASMMEVDGEQDDMPDGVPEGLADGFGQPLQVGLDSGMDPLMLQADDALLMYPDTNSLQYGSVMGSHNQQTSMQPMASQFQAQMMKQDQIGSGGSPKVGYMLAWPGNMSRMTSLYGAKPRSSTNGYEHGIDGER